MRGTTRRRPCAASRNGGRRENRETNRSCTVARAGRFEQSKGEPNEAAVLRLRLRRGRLRLRRQRLGAASVRERLSCARDRAGPSLDAREPAGKHVEPVALAMAPRARAARLLQHALFQARRRAARQCGGRRLDHVREHAARAARQGLARGHMGRPRGLGARDARALRHREAHARRRHEPANGCGRLPAEGHGEADRRREEFLSDRGRRVLRRRRRRARHALRRSVLRRRGPGAHVVHRLRRLHGRLPPRREEHARPQLPVSRRAPRRAGARADEGRRRAPARRARRRRGGLRGRSGVARGGRARRARAARKAASRAAASCSPHPRSARRIC